MERIEAQHGAVMIIVLVGMAVIIAMAGMGIDLGHAYVNKTRLQNLVDATALAAAKRLDETAGDTEQATNEATRTFNLNLNGSGNSELADKISDSDLILEYSNQLYPFAAGGLTPQYVRASIGTVNFDTWFVRLLGIDQTPVKASAVSGPSPTLNQYICGFSPMMVCGTEDADPDDDMYFGYRFGDIEVLKSSQQSNNDGCPDESIGPGNFQLVRLPGNNGADDLREAMAGGYSQCAYVGDGIETETGNNVGPAAQGLNTRLGNFDGPMGGKQDIYPPDVIVQQVGETEVEIPEPSSCQHVSSTTLDDVSFNSNDYDARKQAGNYDYEPAPDGIGGFDRRILRIPIGNCDGTTNGQGSVPFYGVGCFFLMKEVDQSGTNSYVIGQFLESCESDGTPGPEPASGPGPYKIILYEDPDSIDS